MIQQSMTSMHFVLKQVSMELRPKTAAQHSDGQNPPIAPSVSEQLTIRSATGPSQKIAPPPPPMALFPANWDCVRVILEQLGIVFSRKS